MDRRAFSSGITLGLLAAPAQPTTRAPRIGFLWGGTLNPSLLREFEDALQERGWVSGRNITIGGLAQGDRHLAAADQALHGTVCADAQVSTLREHLIKLAVWVERSVRRIVLHLPTSFPWLSTWRHLARAVGATP